MLAMRIVGVAAYTALGAGIGVFGWYESGQTLNAAVCALIGAAAGLALALVSWVRAARAGR